MTTAEEEINPYDLLAIPIEATEQDIRTAYRKLSLKVHPDRHPNNPNAAQKFHELNQAYEALLDPVRRLALDAKIRLKQARQERFGKYDAKRKTMQAELEEREAAFKKRKDTERMEKFKREREAEEIKEAGKRMREEREKAQQEREQEQERQQNPEQSRQPATMPSSSSSSSPLDSTLKFKYSLSAHPTLTTPSLLSTHLLSHRFGPIDSTSIVLSTKKGKVTALVPFVNLADAFTAVCAAGVERRGLKDITVNWASGVEPDAVKRLKEVSKEEEEREGGEQAFNSHVPKSTGSSGLDFESVTLMRLRQAERERLGREIREQDAREDEAERSVRS